MAEDTEVLTENTNHINETVEETTYIGEEKNEKIQNAEPSMLDDETMPTYLSLPSITSSSKLEESKTQVENSSPRSVTQDDKSVYDISSGEESNQQAYEHDHDGGYGESDESEHDDDDSGDDDEDEDDEDETEIEEENDDDIEPEQFERSSDDYVLKNSNTSLSKYFKERSRSLQDLSTSAKKSRKMNCKKLMILTPHDYETVVMKENPMYNSLCSFKKALLPPMKHNNIPAKVKRYINDLKEHNKKSGQQKIDEQLNLVDPLGNCTPKEMHEDENDSTINLQAQCLTDHIGNKTHTRNSRESPNFIEVNINNHVVENGIGIEVVDIKNNCNKPEEMDMEVEFDDVQVKDTNCNEQVEKLNGQIEHIKENIKTSINYKKTGNDDQQDLTNGEKQNITILNLQTSNKDSTIDNFREVHNIEEVKMDDHEHYIDENEVVIKPINMTSTISAQDAQKIIINETMMKELKKKDAEVEEKNSQIIFLQSQLNRKEKECEKIGKEYRKVIDTISELRKERETLKKMLETLTNEKKLKESKEVAVQTEDQLKTMGHTSTKTQLQPPSNKISASSIGSTLSSIEQWTASDYSPVVSMNPPNIGNLINSDASTTINTPRDKGPANSPRTILTATRIIQALASMTPGKTDGNGGQIPDIQGQLEETTSPLIQKESNSRKRKASETFGSSVSGSKPFKIPFINTNDHKKFNSNSDTDAAGESFGASPRGLTENDEINGNHEKKQINNEKSDEDDVKCIVWHENGQTKQRSCLIQASVADDSPKAKGQVRHCGPYLLGNVEVRISEANGTLNIWGKELNAVEDKADDLNECSSDKMNNTENLWIKSPLEKSDDQCSKHKKSKTASSVKASICRHLRSIINRTPSPVNHAADEEDSLNHHNCGNSTCGFKEINKTKNLQKSFSTSCYSHFNNLSSPDKQFCCLHKGEESLGECGFKKDEGMTDNIHYLYDMTRTIIGQDSKSTIHPINNQTYNCCKNQIPREERTKNNSKRSSLLHQCSFNSETENPYIHSCKRPCYHSSEMTNQSRETRNDENDLHNCGTSCPNEEDDFISPRFSEVIEEKKNRYRGKRVRGIVDFLKGCGDCRNPHTTSFDSSHIPETISTNTRSIPSIRIDSAPSTLSCPKQSLKNSNNKKCCNCKKQIGLTPEIEAELEEFRVAITNLNLKSDALREMLSRVLNTD